MERSPFLTLVTEAWIRQYPAEAADFSRYLTELHKVERPGQKTRIKFRMPQSLMLAITACIARFGTPEEQCILSDLDLIHLRKTFPKLVTGGSR